MDEVRIGVIGLGGRGLSMMFALTDIAGVYVPACCDNYEPRLENAKAELEKNGKHMNIYSDYREMIEKEDLDAVYIATTWITHSKIAIDCMNSGLHAGIEVGGAASEYEVRELIRTSEKTGKFTMMMENCCYDRKEMAVFNMVKKGLFGEITHLEGGYRHDLRDEIVLGRENHHGRLANFKLRDGELYPTHELGPLMELIDINRGNRFLYLTSMSSKSAGLNEWIRKNKGEDYDLYKYRFGCGDVTTTMIKCARGETILLNHDCSTPRPYSRAYTVEGTNGIFEESHDDHKGWIHLDGDDGWLDFDESYYEKYAHPLWKLDETENAKIGHGGMDVLILEAFADAVRTGDAPIDIYDTATLMAVTYLSEQSAAMGSAPVPFPDFTDGSWISPKPYRRSKYCLREVCEDLFYYINQEIIFVKEEI